MNDTKILITNIQRCSLHDGPGIRTTVFIKGCTLRCPWCCNPENIKQIPQKYIKDGVESVFGEYYTANQLYVEIIKDKGFYANALKNIQREMISDLDKLPGGVTFSGGECLTQIERLEPLCKKLKEECIHMTVETSLFVSKSKLELAIKYIDFFIVDVKILDEKLCRNVLGGRLDVYLSNLDYLMQSEKLIVLRIPIIAGYTDSAENRKKIVTLLNQYKEKILKVELIKEHNLGLEKYRSLIICNKNINMPIYRGVTDEFLELYRQEILKRTQNNIVVEICKL